MKKDYNATIKYVRTNLCIPMPEVSRNYYNQYDYQWLKTVIKLDGFDNIHAIGVLWNKEKQLYEVFDGIHRTQIARELGIDKIPVKDYTGKIKRSTAIEKGIKGNQGRSPYNPLDLAKALSELARNIVKETGKERKKGRPVSVNYSKLYECMHMSIPKMKQYLRLLKLPKDVQTLIGRGSIRFNIARYLCTYLGTPYEKYIGSVAEKASKEKMNLPKVIWYMKSVIDKKAFPEDTSSECARIQRHIKECPSCATKFAQVNKSKAEQKKHIKMNDINESIDNCCNTWKEYGRKDALESLKMNLYDLEQKERVLVWKKVVKRMK